MEQPRRIEDMTDEELARLESRLFCAGGPPSYVEARVAGAQAGQAPGPRLFG